MLPKLLRSRRGPVGTPKTRSRSSRRTTIYVPGTKTKTSKEKKEKEHVPSDVVAFPVDTLNRSKCLKQGNVSMILGHGTFGQVYDFCDVKQNCKYVLKLQTLQAPKHPTSYSPTDLYIREVFFHTFVQENSVLPMVPKLFDHWVCVDASIVPPQSIGIGCMLMERWGGSLDKRALTWEELQRLEAQVNIWRVELVRLKLDHRDVYLRNILFRGEGPNIEFALTDWGLAAVNSDTTNLQTIYQAAFDAVMQKVQIHVIL